MNATGGLGTSASTATGPRARTSRNGAKSRWTWVDRDIDDHAQAARVHGVEHRSSAGVAAERGSTAIGIDPHHSGGRRCGGDLGEVAARSRRARRGTARLDHAVEIAAARPRDSMRSGVPSAHRLPPTRKADRRTPCDHGVPPPVRQRRDLLVAA